ncbi:GPI-anchored small secreted protein [Laccaria bicolor S238N-H82]|uniref:GPI-anchored small secreted protein n=1 Tax=Laccaria bicolor (strain S238N-H82 / ATCC MYA-4686) TaxID=486041 RepID=B0DSE5_LACBS|nr:GPI-anchored small secreted protein [Laccaria bicolor S238N-H82]EDR02531.1 GPI-anchored small secreted protein [Laccaria bicolor S238N-H82]|eukprot:XP_001886894.1 GPI-anchored small secreted protein [Laccaria bicolor S238N-H82]
MHFSTVTLVSLTLLASHAVALVPRSPFVQQLSARQLSTDGCPTCSTVDSNINACPDDSCLCTAAFADALSTCLNCLYAEQPTPKLLTDENKLISDFDDACPAFSIPPVKTSSGGATTATPIVSSTSLRVTSTTKTSIATSVAAGTTVSPPKETATAVTGTDATKSTSSSSSSSSGNVIPTHASGATSAQIQALVVPAAVVLGGFLALM